MINPFAEDINIPEGSYRARHEGSLMMRAGVVGGILTPSCLRAVAQAVATHGDGQLMATGRQNFQMYHLDADHWTTLHAALMEIGLVGRSKHGDLVVNTMSGLDPKEAFDVRPYMEALWQWLASPAGLLDDLPGKFKIAFSSEGVDRTGSTSYTDLAFYARDIDGERYFDVYGGGSLGAQPRLAVLLEEALPADDLLLAAQALMEVFIDLFADSTVFKKRLRFKVREIGEEGFVAAYRAKKESIADAPTMVLQTPEVPDYHWAAETAQDDPRVIATKYPGIYAVRIAAPGGLFDASFLIALVDALEALPHPTEIRLDANHSIYVAGLNGHEATALLAQVDAQLPYAEQQLASRVLNCVGASRCRFGLVHTDALLQRLAEMTEDGLPPVMISGCMNSCGRHQVAALGLFGKKPNAEDPMEEGYDVYIGGHPRGVTEATMSERVGLVRAGDVPEFLRALANMHPAEEDWSSFLLAHRAEVASLLQA